MKHILDGAAQHDDWAVFWLRTPLIAWLIWLVDPGKTMKTILLIISLFAGVNVGFAESTLYTISLKKSASFEIVSGGAIAIYPLSERMKPMIQKSRNRSIEAADYDCGTKIKMAQPKMAVQEIMRQVADQTGLSLGSFINSQLVEAEPTVILMAAGENSVWQIVLTSKGADSYALTLSYLIDEKKKA